MHIPISQLEGRDHYVVPTVMIKVGTFTGSSGAVHYTMEALRSSVNQWNGKPVVVYHPSMADGSYANSPRIFNKQKIGLIFNTRMVGDKLKADAWIDVQRVASVDNRVHRAIVSKRPMEVSTGLVVEFMQNQAQSRIAQRLIPDHLAVLPDQIGACSMADGAGLIVNELFWGTPQSHEVAILMPLAKPEGPSWVQPFPYDRILTKAF
jgi:hypothetical protein